MGLAERRVAKEFETKRFPQLKQEVDAAATFAVPVEVKWETLANDKITTDASNWAEAWEKVYFKPLVQALKAITIDDMGKDALKGGLKKIVIQNTTGAYYGDRWAAFLEGTLTLDHEPCSNIDNIDERAEGLQKVLEKAL